jgi:hypothetical protein
MREARDAPARRERALLLRLVLPAMRAPGRIATKSLK